MKLIHSVTFLILLAHGIHGWTATEVTKNGTDGEGDCVSTNSDVGIMSVGEKKYLNGSCFEATCGGGGVITMNGCGVYRFRYDENDCKIEEDLSKPYPDCCTKLICKDTTTEEPNTESTVESDATTDENPTTGPTE